MPGPDLHLHSTASDGTLSPSQIVALAESVFCPVISLTDHDTVAGVSEALEAARDTTVSVIPGVELSAGVGDRGIHLLGYHIDHTDSTFLTRLARLRQIRLERAERIVHALARDGFALTIDDVLEVADGGSVGRAHIAQLLVSTGRVPSVNEAFVRLLGSSAPYYVPKPVSAPEEVVGWITDAGGVAVLAHPALSNAEDLIPMLRQAGIAGIEAYHSAHDAASSARLAALARSLGLVATGGSDFHGAIREGEGLGTTAVPDSVVAELEAARDARRTCL